MTREEERVVIVISLGVILRPRDALTAFPRRTIEERRCLGGGGGKSRQGHASSYRDWLTNRGRPYD